MLCFRATKHDYPPVLSGYEATSNASKQAGPNTSTSSDDGHKPGTHVDASAEADNNATSTSPGSNDGTKLTHKHQHACRCKYRNKIQRQHAPTTTTEPTPAPIPATLPIGFRFDPAGSTTASLQTQSPHFMTRYMDPETGRISDENQRQRTANHRHTSCHQGSTSKGSRSVVWPSVFWRFGVPNPKTQAARLNMWYRRLSTDHFSKTHLEIFVTVTKSICQSA